MTRQELRVFLQTWQCGCGCPEDATRLVYDVLQAMSERWVEGRKHDLFVAGDRPALEAVWKRYAERIKALLPTSGVEYFVLYLFDHWGLTEHGGGVGGCWLTDKGQAVLDALGREIADDFTTLHAPNCCIHGYADGDEDLHHICQ